MQIPILIFTASLDFQPFAHEAFSHFCLRYFAAWIDIVRISKQPTPSPLNRKVPPPAGPARSSPPAQAIVPVPIPIGAAKTKRASFRKSLVRITATSVEPDYKAPWNAGALRARRRRFLISGNRHSTNGMWSPIAATIYRGTRERSQ